MAQNLTYTIDNDNTSYWARKYAHNDGVSTVPEGDQAGAVNSDQSLDDFIKSGFWVTPMEYYAKASTINLDGYATYNDTKLEYKYFWIEDLKNWGTYTYDSFGDDYSNRFYLCLWNGRDNWIPFNDDMYVDEYSDKYGIRNFQNILIKKLLDKGRNIMQQRGHAIELNMAVSERNNPKYIPKEDSEWLQVVHAFRLQKATKYVINNSNDFQTISYQTQYINVKYPADTVSFAQTNFRVGVVLGCPCIWRLPTGELAMCTKLHWNSDCGISYYYKKIDEYGFKAVTDPFVTKTGLAYNKFMLGKEDITDVTSYLNGVCAQFFGKGETKTIETDWLRDYRFDISLDEYKMASKDNYKSMLNSELMFEQHNINKENSLKCSFEINRPVVTTTEKTNKDYIKKW